MRALRRTARPGAHGASGNSARAWNGRWPHCVKIEWLPSAESSFTTQMDWIAERDPWAATDLGDTILAGVGRLSEHPLIVTGS